MNEKASNIHEFKFKINATNPVTLLNVSDVHWDSRKCDRKLLKRHFDHIKKIGGYIFVNGDLLDVMGMKLDPRSIPNDIRPEYMKPGETYLQSVIDDCYNFLKNYAENILLISFGNHETNILRKQQICPLTWLVKLLNDYLQTKGSEHRVELGAYNGGINMKFKRSGNGSFSKKIYYHHGSGGGAKRSKGILNADLLMSQHQWADIITSGHDHNKWHLPRIVRDCDFRQMKWKRRKIDILRTGSYKKKSDTFGWEIEKDFDEPALGGFFIKFVVQYREDGKERELGVVIEEAT